MTEKQGFKLDIEEMAQAGLHFGHRVSATHPKMEPYLAGMKNTTRIIDLEKTKEKLKDALEFIRQLTLENKVMLLVGTKIQAKDLVKEVAKDCNLPYVVERWVGGTFTNFDVIKKRIAHFKELERKKEDGELEKYTKKEIAKINQELQNLEKKFGGIKNLEKLPDAIFVLDLKKDNLAAKEARRKGIKVVGICDTNVDPSLADYPIPANDDAISSLKYILDKVRKVILQERTSPEETKFLSKKIT